MYCPNEHIPRIVIYGTPEPTWLICQSQLVKLKQCMHMRLETAFAEHTEKWSIYALYNLLNWGKYARPASDKISMGFCSGHFMYVMSTPHALRELARTCLQVCPVPAKNSTKWSSCINNHLFIYIRCGRHFVIKVLVWSRICDDMHNIPAMNIYLSMLIVYNKPSLYNKKLINARCPPNVLIKLWQGRWEGSQNDQPNEGLRELWVEIMIERIKRYTTHVPFYPYNLIYLYIDFFQGALYFQII